MEVISFILKYFVTKNLSMVTCFLCWTPDQISKLYRIASFVGVRVLLVSDFERIPQMTPRGMFREAMLVDLACPDVDLVLKQASASRGFNYRHSWLLLDNSTYDRSVIDATLSEYDILPDADVVWSSTDKLVDVYRVKRDKLYLHTNLGLDRNCSKQAMAKLWLAMPSVVTRRKNLRNTFLNGVIVVSQPELFKGWSDLRDRQNDPFPKVTYPLLMLISQDLHFRYNMLQKDFYGVSHNGTFDGAVGVLQRHQAEVVLASLFQRSDRMEVVDFISETFKFETAFIFRQPSRSAVSNVFLAPFSGGVWAASGGVCACAALLLAALTRLRQRTRPNPTLAQLTLPDSCTFALGTMCQQGFHITPTVTSVRVVMFSALLMSLFVFTAYSAKIVAILHSPSDALRSIDDLTRSPMHFGVQETTYKKTYFMESTDEAVQRLWRHKILPQGEQAYIGVEEGVARVRAGFFAYQVELSAGYDAIKQTFTEREKCGLQEIQAYKVPRGCIPMRKHSGYRELFAARLRWLREVGLMDRSRRIWLTSRPRCEVGDGGFVTIGIIDVLPALQALALGACLAVLLLAAEVSVYIVKRKIKKYQDRVELPKRS